MDLLPKIEDYHNAYANIKPIITRTALLQQKNEILLKPEVHQLANSFKIRGVFHAVSRIQKNENGISTVSAGNTAQALAWCGQYFKVPAYSIMPQTAPQTKIDAVKKYGGIPILVSTQEVFSYLQNEKWHDDPYTFIHPWTNRNVMTGHGSIGIEILEDYGNLDSVFIPVGGGGLVAGVAGYIKQVNPSIKVYGVEPQGCPSLHESLRQKKEAAVTCNTICDGVAVPYITKEMYPILEKVVDKVILVSDEKVKSAIRTLAIENKIIVEPSGALAFAAACEIDVCERGKSVCIVSGGSIDMDKFIRFVS